jgi:hypothetical protein
VDAPREIDERSFDEIRVNLALARGDEQAEFERIRVELEEIGEKLRRFSERPRTANNQPAEGS